MSFNVDRQVWLFPGQGSQEIGMGRALLDKFASARAVLELAEQSSGIPLGEIIQRGPESRLTQTNTLQPALVAISLGYVELLRESGAIPLAVAGHSLGEITALYAAGVITLADAIRLGVERGRLMNEAAEGGMTAVKDLAPEKIEEILAGVTNGIVVVANYNARSQTVISGDINALDEVALLLTAAGGTCVKLNVSGAWHSPLVKQAAEQFETILDTVHFDTPSVPLVLGVTGQVAEDAEQIRAVMKKQIVSPVRWTKVTETLLTLGADKFLEVGPGKVLRGLLRKNIDTALRYEVSGVDNARTVNELLSSATKES
ncbi:MAG: ACP S-malonyltransferase [Pirellulaceae bacterium]|nr:ACP S-malonyltransferase [Pirellulaceae bacterium]